MEIPDEQAVRLNIGAGHKRIEGYISIDLAGNPDVVADIRALPFPDDFADEAMAIHVLEHIQRYEAEDTLREWRRVLKPGGLLVLELPDLIKCCKNVLTNPDARLGMWGLFGDPGYRNELMVHKWAWSIPELVNVLREIGFRKVRVREPQYHKVARDMRIEARA